MNFYQDQINSSNILKKLKISEKKYFLLTSHRQENVDNPFKLKSIIEVFK